MTELKNPPTADELKAAKALLWALDASQDELEQQLSSLEIVAMVSFLRLPKGERDEALERVPQFTWAFKHLDAGGKPHLESVIERAERSNVK